MGLVWLFSGGKSLLIGGGPDSRDERRAVSDPPSMGASNSRVFAAAQSNIADLLERQPLALGVIGLGIGAAMAAAMPPTAVEADLLGQASADFQAKARVVVEDVTERAADLADGVTAAITKEAQEQGLTADSIKQSASDSSRKVQNVVAHSTERLHAAARAGK
jgi:hypothetical protein